MGTGVHCIRNSATGSSGEGHPFNAAAADEVSVARTVATTPRWYPRAMPTRRPFQVLKKPP